MGKSPWIKPPKGYIDINEFAAMLGVVRRTIYYIIKRGEFNKLVREGNRYFFEKKAAEAFKKIYCR
jgi:predicted DNA-binding transcriptional regulator AlpA